MPLLLAVLLSQAVHGWVDVFFGLNTNWPADGASFLPGTGTTARRANEFSLNVAALDLAADPKPVGFHLTLAAGSGVDVLHSGEPAGPGIGAQVFRVIYQASVSWAAPVGAGLLLEAGIYPSHIGYESFFSKDNVNYTRSWMGEYSPYYQTGIKASYVFDPDWSAQLHLMNGWNLIGDNNRSKAVGTRLQWTNDRATIALNTFAGPELPGDDSHWRLFGDLTAQFKATAALSLGATLDVGWQDRAAGAAVWHGAGIYGRYTFSDVVGLALRAEYYDDRDGFMSGTAQLLTDGTVTLDVRPAEHLLLKLEGREDLSDAAVFTTRRGTSKTQTLAIASAVASF